MGNLGQGDNFAEAESGTFLTFELQLKQLKM